MAESADSTSSSSSSGTQPTLKGIAWRVALVAFLVWQFMNEFVWVEKKGKDGKPLVKTGPASGAVKSVKPQKTEKAQQYSVLGLPLYDDYGKPLPAMRDLFPPDERLSLRVYISEEDRFSSFEERDLAWFAEDIYYNFDEDNTRNTFVNFSITPGLLSNGSAFAHVFLTRNSFSPNPRDKTFNPRATIAWSEPLVVYRPPPVAKGKRNLIAGSMDTEETAEDLAVQELASEGKYLPYWRPKLTINYVHGMGVIDRRTALPAHLLPYFRADRKTGHYFPPLWVNDFWVRKDSYIPINSSVTSLPLELEISPMGRFKFEWMVSWDQQMAKQEEFGLQSGGAADDMKKMFLETSPWLLGLTMAVSLLHMLFDFLAFKNDISFWRNNKSLKGLSLRSIVMSCVFQTVIFLYLADNETSKMILVSSGIGLLIEYWKLTKAVTFEVDWLATPLPKLLITPKDSYRSTATEQHDQVAMKHLTMAMFPAVFGYAFFSLVHGEHKGWYSWVISSLVGFIYAFGFIMMTPQLYLNYKLKSVAHLPWRAMVYKSLNTFIDDLFAFIIEMPMMHRISCLRDDIIFFIFLYQKWIYPVDHARKNEFGVSGDDYEHHAKGKPKSAPAIEGKKAVAAEGVATSGSSDRNVSKRKKRSKFDR